MPPVRNGPYANVDDRTAAAAAAAAAAASSLHISPVNHHLINDSKISMHGSHLSMQSPVSASMAISSKQCNQYGSSSSPAMMQQQQQQQQHHHSSGSSQQSIQHAPLTKAELRKSNKPIMEKKRRARINHCLNELKTLILEAMKKDPARHTKLEKADILEMTVKYLQTMQRNQINVATASAQNDPTVYLKFKAGFSDCRNEVVRYISQIDGVDASVKQRLMGHLNNCVTGIQPVATPYSTLSGSSGSPNYSYRSPPNFNSSTPDLFTSSNGSGSTPLYQQLPMNLPAHTEINNNNRIQMGGVQFIPSRLPSGEFALVMPNSANGNGGGGGMIGDVGGGGAGGNSGGINSSSSTPDHWKPYYPMESLSLRHSSALDLNETAIKRSAFSNVSKKHLVDTSPLSPASSMSSIDDSSSSLNQMDFQTSVDTSSPQRTPQKLNLSAFPTPPSGGSISLIPTSHHSTLASMATVTAAASLQQPHVTSTTEQQATQKLRPISLELHLKDGDMETSLDYQESTLSDAANNHAKKKRPHPSRSPSNKGDNNNDTAAAAAAMAEAAATSASTGNNNNDQNDVEDDLDADDTESPPLKCTKSEPKDYSINSDESNNNDDDQSEMCSGDMWRPW